MSERYAYSVIFMKGDLASGHIPRLFEVLPWSVDDCDVILLVAYSFIIFISLTRSIEWMKACAPSIELACLSVSVEARSDTRGTVEP